MAIQLPRQGAGFLLRAPTHADADAIADIEFDPEVKGFLALPAKPKADWVASFSPDLFGGWIIEVDGEVAGRASISKAKRRGDGELIVVVGKRFLGRKLGRAVAAMLIEMAFAELRAKALVGVVHPDHAASIALLRSLKFRRRGVHAGGPDWQDGHLIYRLSRGVHEGAARR